MSHRRLNANMRIEVPRWALALGLAVAGLHGRCATGALDAMELASQVSVENYRNYLQNDLYTHNGDDRGCQGPQHDPAMRNIQMRFQSFGLDTSLGPPFPSCSRLNYNVVGLHRGVVCPNEVYVVGAHYDTVEGSPGAWDNGSGVAGVLEAGRVLSQYPFEATIVFVAFDREEEGRKGSDAYAEELHLDHIRGTIALDGIAYRPYPPTDPDYGRVGLYYQIRRPKLVDDLAAALWSYAALHCVITQDDLTDDAPFARRGFAAAALISRGLTAPVRPFMHTPQDSVDIPGYIDYDYGAQVTQGVVGHLATQARLAPVRVLPDFNGDHVVNFKDFALLAQYWGPRTPPFSIGPFPSWGPPVSPSDIAPPPNGDGVVRFQDLAGLSYYWVNRWSNWWPAFGLPAGLELAQSEDAGSATDNTPHEDVSLGN